MALSYPGLRLSCSFPGGSTKTHFSLLSISSFWSASFHWKWRSVTHLSSIGKHTKVSWLISPASGANMDWTMNLCLFFSLGSNSNGWRLTAMLTSVLGSTTPELGLTQYLERTLFNIVMEVIWQEITSWELWSLFWNKLSCRMGFLTSCSCRQPEWRDLGTTFVLDNWQLGTFCLTCEG